MADSGKPWNPYRFEWTPASEPPPPHWQSEPMCFIPLLLAMKDRHAYPNPVIGYFIGGRLQKYRVGNNPQFDEPTHWMPLPPLP